MAGGGSFTSDQTTINMAVIGGDTLAKTGRARVTSIQGEGIAGSTIILYDSADASSPGTAVATYNYNTEGNLLLLGYSDFYIHLWILIFSSNR